MHWIPLTPSILAPNRSHGLRPLCQTLLLFVLLALCATRSYAAEPLNGTALDEGYRDMYNLRFADAHVKLQQWMSAHPQDPMGPVSDAAAFLFGEFERLQVSGQSGAIHTELSGEFAAAQASSPGNFGEYGVLRDSEPRRAQEFVIKR